MDPIAYAEAHRDEILKELVAFARIPSVSTDPAYAEHIGEAADWVAERMRRAGFEQVRINPTTGHPIVTGAWLKAPGAPTILVYGHYDVQPPDPLDKWKSPPFEPTVRDERLYARGVSDDKGPMLIPLKAAEAFMQTLGRLPINVKLVIEGEARSLRRPCSSPSPRRTRTTTRPTSSSGCSASLTGSRPGSAIGNCWERKAGRKAEAHDPAHRHPFQFDAAAAISLSRTSKREGVGVRAE